MSSEFKIVIEQEESTVIAHYEHSGRDNTGYQSEAQLEKALIEQLCRQGYDYPDIHTEEQLINNLRKQLETLNNITFSNAEWKRLFDNDIANETYTVERKTEIIQKDHIRLLTLDDGTTKNIYLIDKRNIHNNHLQVINQYVPEGSAFKNRYDVTILVNGLPLVHIELKRRGVSIKEAFNQINRYQRESMWSGSGLFEYAQIFVISNGTQTKYYSNTTRYAKYKESDSQKLTKVKRESNSFEFTSYWSDEQNNIITELEEFAETFLAKGTLLRILTRYCVFTVDKVLLAMRPYQIAATEKILLRIKTALNNKWQGSIRGGGYIWHTTGSGKTLTSFKTAQLATGIEGVNKVLFVVDRQDLDYQTMLEYDHFEPGCANSNSNTKILINQLNDDECSIIITTIQKLTNALKSNEKIKVLDQNIVLIFDECHRSQFGDMHNLIVKRFKRYMMFGFTGTPIFAANANPRTDGPLSTTKQVFGDQLHTYTIVDAIRDHNVLKFKVDYINTIKAKHDIENQDVWGIETEKALRAPIRIEEVSKRILHDFNIKTKRSESYSISRLMNVSEVIKKGKKAEEERNKVFTKGFNAMLACESVKMAILYYKELKRQIEEQHLGLKIATIFTFNPNEAEDENGFITEDPEAIAQMDASSKEALESAIQDYNKMFDTRYSLTNSDGFRNYYKDVSLRMKNKEIDLLVVMGMFLTGFDAKCLNTLFVDKPLKMHGLLQAFSRTNRILNSVKDCGNIICFRNLAKRTDDCFELFGDKDAAGIIKMRSWRDYYYGFDEKGKHQQGYSEIALALKDKFPVENLSKITSDAEKKDFIRMYGNYLRAFNLLLAFDEFNSEDIDELNRVRIIKVGEKQDYTSWYVDIYEEMRKQIQPGGDKVDIEDDLEFEIELVKQVQIDITYILILVQKYHDSHCKDKEILIEIDKGIASSPDMRNKRELIERFVESMDASGSFDVYEEWRKYVDEQKERELNEIIETEKLKPEATREFMENAFRSEAIEETGTEVVKLLPPMPLFGGGGAKARAVKKKTVIEKLKEFLEKYLNI